MASLRLNITRGLVLCGAIALILTMTVFFRRRARGAIARTTILFTLLGFVHYWVTVVFLMYPFIFSSRYDAFYLILSVLLMMHWVVVGECILSFIEKKMIDPQYQMGETSLKHPYSDDMFSSPAFQNMYHYVERMTGIIVFCVVFFRYATKTLSKRFHVPILFLSVLLLINGLYTNTDILVGVRTTMIW
jgi:hypothetical protein